MGRCWENQQNKLLPTKFLLQRFPSSKGKLKFATFKTKRMNEPESKSGLEENSLKTARQSKSFTWSNTKVNKSIFFPTNFATSWRC